MNPDALTGFYLTPYDSRANVRPTTGWFTIERARLAAQAVANEYQCRVDIEARTGAVSPFENELLETVRPEGAADHV